MFCFYHKTNEHQSFPSQLRHETWTYQHQELRRTNDHLQHPNVLQRGHIWKLARNQIGPLRILVTSQADFNPCQSLKKVTLPTTNIRREIDNSRKQDWMAGRSRGCPEFRKSFLFRDMTDCDPSHTPLCDLTLPKHDTQSDARKFWTQLLIPQISTHKRCGQEVRKTNCWQLQFSKKATDRF